MTYKSGTGKLMMEVKGKDQMIRFVPLAPKKKKRSMFGKLKQTLTKGAKTENGIPTAPNAQSTETVPVANENITKTGLKIIKIHVTEENASKKVKLIIFAEDTDEHVLADGKTTCKVFRVAVLLGLKSAKKLYTAAVLSPEIFDTWGHQAWARRYETFGPCLGHAIEKVNKKFAKKMEREIMVTKEVRKFTKLYTESRNKAKAAAQAKKD